MMKPQTVSAIGIFLLLFVIQACSPSIGTPTTARINASQAYQTVESRLTQAQFDIASQAAVRSLTPSPATETPTPQTSPSPQPTTTYPLPSSTPSPTPACDRAAAGNPIDVTIPDDSVMEPGQSFTKIWRLQNSGECTWNTSYTAQFFYGAQMGAPNSVSLPQNTAKGETVEISIDMVAPNNPGTYQGNWKLSNTAGQLFGIGPNGNAPFWVRIVVKQPISPTVQPTSTPTFTPSPTSTSTPTSTPTLTPTPTPTPPIQVSGSISLVPPTLFDLDTGTTGSAGDLEYQIDASNFHMLIPQALALLGVYGNEEPGPAACQHAGMSNAPIALESLSLTTYLCYQTNEGLIGWLQYTALDSSTGALTVNFHTWAAMK